MSEKKENIKNGLDIEVDGGNVIVLNNVSVAEKKEEIPSIIKTEEQPIVPDVKITNEVPSIPTVEIPLPEAPETSTPDFKVPNINNSVTPEVVPNIEVAPVMPTIPTAPLNQAPSISDTSSSPIMSNDIANNINNNLFNQGYNNFQTETVIAENNKIFKSTSDVEKLSEEVAREVKEALNNHVVYPMKATTDLLHDLYQWGEEVANNGLNRALLEKYDELKQKYTDLESVCEGTKSISDINNFNNNNFNNNNFNSNFGRVDDDNNFNNFGGFGGFGKAA